MLTCAVAVDEPEALVAVNVYVVVAVGLTVVEPLADADVNVPGVMAIVVAPDVTQLSVLLDPELMPAGLAVKELITGFPDVLTLTTAVAVTEPVVFVAVNVYVVDAVGLTVVEPVVDVDVNVPGAMAIVVAPDVAQLSVLLAPELMVAGDAAKEVMAGSEPLPEGPVEAPPQFNSPTQAERMRSRAQSPFREEQRSVRDALSPCELSWQW